MTTLLSVSYLSFSNQIVKLTSVSVNHALTLGIICRLMGLSFRVCQNRWILRGYIWTSQEISWLLYDTPVIITTVRTTEFLDYHFVLLGAGNAHTKIVVFLKVTEKIDRFSNSHPTPPATTLYTILDVNTKNSIIRYIKKNKNKNEAFIYIVTIMMMYLSWI